MTFIFFNLLVNSIFSLVIGLLLVFFFLWVFRVETGRWKLFLLSLPFVKIGYDFLQGVPDRSILRSGVDPFVLPAKHQMISIGAGVDGWIPYVSTVFSVNDLSGHSYNSSVGDYFAIWMHRKVGDPISFAIVSTILFISFGLLLLRLFSYVKFESRRRKDRRRQQALRVEILGRRQVDVYVSGFFSGTPFTGGVLKPFICIPGDAHALLSSDELNAVIAHELGHVRYYDLLVTVMIQSMGDLFWFVPGYRWLSRKIDRLREIVADKWALSSGIEPEHLASALIGLRELPGGTGDFVLYSALFREKSLLKERVERLMGRFYEKAPRFGWQKPYVRIAAVIFILIVVLNSVFGGNFKNDAAKKAPEWIEDLFKVSCLCVNQKFYAQV